MKPALPRASLIAFLAVIGMIPLSAQAQVDAVAALQLAEQHQCFTCHHSVERKIGPSFKDIADKYRGNGSAAAQLARKIQHGGKGVWGDIEMPARPELADRTAGMLAQWVLAQAPTVEANQSAALSAQAIIASRCSHCHGNEGEGANLTTPRLAAQHADYLVKQMLDFQRKKRISTVMNPIAMDLREGEVRAIAAYYAGKPAVASRGTDPELAAVGRYLFQRGNPHSGTLPCMQCHGKEGHGSAILPRIAGQQADYIEQQLRNIVSGKRTNDGNLMHSATGKLGELEIKALAEYVSTLR